MNHSSTMFSHSPGAEPSRTLEVFTRAFFGVGVLALRTLRIPDDIAVVHDWVTRDYARFWGMQGLDREGVGEAYRQITAPGHVRAYVGVHEGRPSFLVETYHPAEDHLSAYYAASPGDRGMHVLVAPPDRRIPGFTRAVFALILDFLFSDPAADRIVVEPDMRNEKIRALNLAAGFIEQHTLDLPATATTPAKTAMLSYCSRADYAIARARLENLT